MASGAQNNNALLLEVGNVYVGDDVAHLVDLGAVENVKFTGKQTKFKKDSDNRGTIVERIRLNGMIALDWLEPGDASALNNIFKGVVTKTVTAATPVVIVDEPMTLVKNQFVPLLFANGDQTKITPTSVNVTPGLAALTSGVDFEVVLINGKTGIVLSGSYGATSVTVLTDYTYTPNSAQRITGGTAQTATPRVVQIVGPSTADPTKTRVINLAQATAESDLLIEFLDPEKANDLGKLPLSFENRKNAAWYWEDMINP